VARRLAIHEKSFVIGTGIKTYVNRTSPEVYSLSQDYRKPLPIVKKDKPQTIGSLYASPTTRLSASDNSGNNSTASSPRNGSDSGVRPSPRPKMTHTNSNEGPSDVYENSVGNRNSAVSQAVKPAANPLVKSRERVPSNPHPMTGHSPHTPIPPFQQQTSVERVPLVTAPVYKPPNSSNSSYSNGNNGYTGTYNNGNTSAQQQQGQSQSQSQHVARPVGGVQLPSAGSNSSSSRSLPQAIPVLVTQTSIGQSVGQFTNNPVPVVTAARRKNV
jgi:hypothetical protein